MNKTISETLTSTTTVGQSQPGNNGNETGSPVGLSWV